MQENIQDIVGKSFGFWKVLKKMDNKSSSQSRYECQCVCGVIRTITKGNLTHGRSKSCGCGGSTVMKGKRFNRLLVLTDGYKKGDKKRRIYVKVRCDCGIEKEVLKQSLESGLTQSCGCLNTEILKSHNKENHHNYNPNLTDEERVKNNSRGSTDGYQKLRRNTLKRDTNTCQCCGYENNKNMRVHHINSWSDNKDLRFDIDNTITLCPQCHDIQYNGSFHNLYKNGNNTRSQLQEYINNKRFELGLEPKTI